MNTTTGQNARDNTARLIPLKAPSVQAQVEANSMATMRGAQPATISQGYQGSGFRDAGDKAYHMALFEQTANLLPGGGVGMKALKGEEITKRDLAVEAAITLLPWGRLQVHSYEGGSAFYLEKQPLCL